MATAAYTLSAEDNPAAAFVEFFYPFHYIGETSMKSSSLTVV